MQCRLCRVTGNSMVIAGSRTDEGDLQMEVREPDGIGQGVEIGACRKVTTRMVAVGNTKEMDRGRKCLIRVLINQKA